MSLFIIGFYWCSASCKLYFANSPSEAGSNGAFPPCTHLHRSRIISMTEYIQKLLKNLMFLIGLRLGIQILKSQYIFTSTSCTLLQAVLPLCLHGCGCLLFLACAEEILLRHIPSWCCCKTHLLAWHSSTSPLFVSPPAAPFSPLHWTYQSAASLSSVLGSRPVYDVPSLLFSPDVPWALISLCPQQLSPKAIIFAFLQAPLCAYW